MSSISRFTACAFRPAFRAPIVAAPRQFLQTSTLLAARKSFHTPALRYASTSRLGLGLGLAGLATTGLLWEKQAIKCDVVEEELPESGLNIQNLGFGTAAGICSGVFVAKGLKAIAFLLGGLFIVLQYLSSQSLAKTNWRSIESKYDSLMDKAAGAPSVSTISNRTGRIFSRFTDFLMADFPPRATFMAGFILGLRLG